MNQETGQVVVRIGEHEVGGVMGDCYLLVLFRKLFLT